MSKTLAWAFYLVLLVIAIVSVGVFGHSQLTAFDKADELARLENENDILESHLNVQKQRLQKLIRAESQTKRWKNLLHKAFSQYRDASDLAENPSKFVIAHTGPAHNAGNTFRFSLPKGNHTLAITVSKTRSGTKEFRYQLPGLAGYQIVLSHPKLGRDKPSQVRLLLSSNSDSFESISQEVFEPMVGRVGANYMTPPILAYPNEMPGQDGDLVLYRSARKGLPLSNVTWSYVSNDGESCDLNFDMRIVTDGPDTVDPESAMSITSKSSFYRVKYLGGGMFELQPRPDNK